MEDDFKKKLTDYTEGKLVEEEREEVESQLEKLQEYQAFLDDQMDKTGDKMNTADPSKRKRESGILRKGKWRARIQNGFMAIGILIIVTIVSGIITSMFYGMGKPSRIEVYRDVVRSTVAVTRPNVRVSGSGMSVGTFLSMSMEAGLQKRVGSSYVKAGEMDVLFLLGQAGYPESKWYLDEDQYYPFAYPGSEVNNTTDGDWSKLEMLPEGTVAEAYISLDRFYTTEEILGKFKDRDMSPLWFAVDTGFDDPSSSTGGPIGFPYAPLWHSDDWTLTDRTVKKLGLFGRKEVMESREAPEVDAYGSGQLREENFIKTLNLLERYEGIADRVAGGPRLSLEKRIKYIDEHGVNIYAVVVTGPTREILKLKQEAWTGWMFLGEVRLWNWEG